MKWAASLLACAVLVAGASDAAAAKKDKKDPVAKDAASAKPALVSSYGDWKVYHSASGKAKICYVLAEPKKRDPDGDEKAYAFISERPSEHVRNEVSFVMGFDLATADDLKDKKKERKHAKKGDPDAADSAAPTAEIGDAAFDLAPTGANLWVKNPAEEGKVIDEMRKGASLVIKASSRKGRAATLTYSLAGFSQAIDKAIKDCPTE